MRLSKEKEAALRGMAKNHMLMFSNGKCFCGENHPYLERTILRSEEWKAWEEEAYKKGWDWAETTELGWMSDGHWKAFVAFLRKGSKKEGEK